MEISSRYLNPRAEGTLTEPAPQPCAELTVQELLEWLRQPQYTNGRLDEHAAEHMVSAATLIERLRAALETVRVENDRAKRQFTNISNKILDDACRALEPKP